MFKKYKIINGKRYGPYLYENKRVGDKVVTVYHGLAKEEKTINSKKNIKNFLIFGVLLLLVIFGAFFLYKNFSSTGNAVLSIESEYGQNENLSGTISLLLTEGELIPADSDLTLTLADYSKTYKLQDVVDNQIITG